MNFLKISAILFISLIAIKCEECIESPDLITTLTNFDDATGTLPCMYSGTINVEKETDSNLFYWFFRDEALSDDAPFVLWINGGPGASSMMGMFLENGPLRLVRDANGDLKVHLLSGVSWTSIANVIFLDQPVGTGYSYGHKVIHNNTEYRKQALDFLLKFYEIHPEMKDRDFYITGESFGGIYEPNIAAEIIDYNEKVDEDDRIPLKAVFVGNGYIEMLNHAKILGHLPLSMGLLTFDAIPQLETLRNKCLKNWNNLEGFPRNNKLCMDIDNYIVDIGGGFDIYDFRYPTENRTDQEHDVNVYLNMPSVIEELHMSGSTKSKAYSLLNNTISHNLMPDLLHTDLTLPVKIINSDVILIFYYGNTDQMLGPSDGMFLLPDLNWEHLDDFYMSSREIYYYHSDDNDEIKFGGNFKRYENFYFLTVYEAGHLVPTTQLALSRQMLVDIFEEGELQCHHPENKCKVDSAACEYMNYCNNHGQCKNGHCICEEKYFGADCSVKLIVDFSTELNFTLEPMHWEYFQLNGDYSNRVNIFAFDGVIEATANYDEIPSPTYHTSYSRGNRLEFLVQRYQDSDELMAKKQIVGVFNPDDKKSITFKIDVTNDERIELILWFQIIFIVVLAFGFIANIMCFYRNCTRREQIIVSDTNKNSLL